MFVEILYRPKFGAAQHLATDWFLPVSNAKKITKKLRNYANTLPVIPVCLTKLYV
jgi:hypothetical protein